MNSKIYNLKNEVVGEITLPEKVFARPWNSDLVHQILQAQIANRRQNLAHTKTRGEVRGGGKKPWRQKGTGRARHGSTRSPLWVHGGVSHGPRNEKIFSKGVNKKMFRAALYAVLSKKLSQGELKVIDSLETSSPKTKDFFVKIKSWLSALLVPAPTNKLLFRVSRNIPKVKAIDPRSLNIEDILKYKNILIDQKGIVEIK